MMRVNNSKQVSNKAVIYLRVSTEEQVENYSLGNQEEPCRKEAHNRNLEIIEVFREEGKSAKTITGRPTLIEMLQYCRKNKNEVSYVIAYRLDRISRQTADFLAIRKKLTDLGVTLLSATEPTGNSPTEKFVETMLAGFAQLDNDVRGERTKSGMRARFLAGLPAGNVPLGYLCESGYAIKDPQSFEQLSKAWQLMATGTKSLSEMSKIMTYWGVELKFNGRKVPLRLQTLNRVFRNKFYAGFITSNVYPEEIRGQHAPMVTEETFYRVQAALDGRNTSIALPIAKRKVDNPDFPLRRMVKCGKCKSPLNMLIISVETGVVLLPLK
jgi:site-specific DNA recombinase